MPKISYQAAWSPEDQEVTVIQNIRAGVSGPFGDYPAATLDEAVRVLFENGYHPVGEWEETRFGEHWADLVYVEVPR
ncbi:hypothetical protein [Streptomyces sp. NPDC087862]|uniref:hypothetical protein n=1 Tax=Streptomyces sp. NPDC087862 TaxID=3365813 RepID=UPI00381F30A0